MPTPTTLEEIIRGLVGRGELSNLSLSMNGSHTKWRASFVPCSVFGQSFAEDVDPIKALMTALTDVKLKSRKAPLHADPRVASIPQEIADAQATDAEIDALM